MLSSYLRWNSFLHCRLERRGELPVPLVERPSIGKVRLLGVFLVSKIRPVRFYLKIDQCITFKSIFDEKHKVSEILFKMEQLVLLICLFPSMVAKAKAKWWSPRIMRWRLREGSSRYRRTRQSLITWINKFRIRLNSRNFYDKMDFDTETVPGYYKVNPWANRFIGSSSIVQSSHVSKEIRRQCHGFLREGQTDFTWWSHYVALCGILFHDMELRH